MRAAHFGVVALAVLVIAGGAMAVDPNRILISEVGTAGGACTQQEPHESYESCRDFVGVCAIHCAIQAAANI